MGGPASSTTAEIYMQAYERTAITTLPDDGEKCLSKRSQLLHPCS